MRAIVVAIAFALGVGSCAQRASAPPIPSPTVPCEITVTTAADGRSGTAACARSPQPAQQVAPTRAPEGGKGKGKARD